MRLRNEVKVGLIVFGALVLITGVYWFLGGFSLRTSTYPIYGIFSNAQKLERGADVRLSGVKIGIVSDIMLTKSSQARVNMLIWNGTEIPSDSEARITTGAFVGEFYVEVLPGHKSTYLKPDQRICSLKVVEYDQLIDRAGSILADLQKTAKSINKVLGDNKMMAAINETVNSIKKSADSASALIQTARCMIERSSPEVERTFANLAKASEHAVDMSAQMQKLFAEDVRPNVKPLIGKAKVAMDELVSTLKDTDDLVSSLGENSGTIKEMLARANDSALQAQKMLTNLNATAESIKGLTTDPMFICNIKATAKNIAEASCKANLAMDKINQKLGAFRSPTLLQKSEIPLYGTSGDALWNVEKGKYRFDTNYTFALEDPMFFRAGLYNIGENTKINFQAGNTFDESNALRYGIYASRVGIGYDHRFGRKVLISTDLFRPDAPELEMRGIFGIGDNFGLYTGVQDLLHEDNRDLLLGIAYNK